MPRNTNSLMQWSLIHDRKSENMFHSPPPTNPYAGDFHVLFTSILQVNLDIFSKTHLKTCPYLTFINTKEWMFPQHKRCPFRSQDIQPVVEASKAQKLISLLCVIKTANRTQIGNSNPALPQISALSSKTFTLLINISSVLICSYH